MIRVGIIGVSGYTGLELIKLILGHPHFELTLAAASSEGEVGAVFPQLCGVLDAKIEVCDSAKIKERCDLVFLALPHTEAMKIAKNLRGSGVKIVDLSADYRVGLENYEANYCPHIDPEGLKMAVYGLVEINRKKVAALASGGAGAGAAGEVSGGAGEVSGGAGGVMAAGKAVADILVANPGCYPTCTLLGLAPFAPMLEPQIGVMVDAKSGVSGAGKGLKASSHFVSVNENLNAYSPLLHRHSDEIAEHLNGFAVSDEGKAFLRDFCQIERGTNEAGQAPAAVKCEGDLTKSTKKASREISVMFVPHLVPLTRGMLVSSYFALKPEFAGIDPLEILREFYKNEPFIRIKSEPVSVKSVAGTHFCDIFAMKRDGKIWVNSAIDNLLRGASSQALANANIICGLDETLGLPRYGGAV